MITAPLGSAAVPRPRNPPALATADGHVGTCTGPRHVIARSDREVREAPAKAGEFDHRTVTP
ncbi:hypothetical protein DR950_21270 [Kitasatospora xanthocidica]|uniref:Uncharacterized protein n=1 Tax=Kitasatospora xanthocidica TaxID=83382 RepID=A0A372ZXL8_9ACTN|nr:hypothetical protein DR950_21270 [Kitasatospora xanthocidica]